MRHFPTSDRILCRALRWEGGPPSDASHISLFEAAAWIATSGGRRPVFPYDLEYWENGCAEVVRKVTGGQISLVGREAGSPLSNVIDGVRLAGLKMQMPFASADLADILGDAPRLVFAVSDSDERWRVEGGDSVTGARGYALYSHLQVAGPDVSKIWPFSDPEPYSANARTTADELRLTARLAIMLKGEPGLAKAEAAERLSIGHRERAFELRIWPNARKSAGLGERAKAGRKKKSAI
ncbi:hypothetical protein GCM10007301_47780 [Azorhizobium oxalatiphilum]|uniref:Uncharacterized protein n=2 Tax=Azorhizobium oxalatiphilum TaxID=980631 RepID=A0A917FID3_9HYPH|nr:hypothetical protein GCM10007301_47780 [Azorhizobium oxalatiphilum]